MSRYVPLPNIAFVPLTTITTSKLSDVVGVDLLGNLSSKIVTETAELTGVDFTHLAPEMEFFWPATTLESVLVTPDMKVCWSFFHSG